MRSETELPEGGRRVMIDGELCDTLVESAMEFQAPNGATVLAASHAAGRAGPNQDRAVVHCDGDTVLALAVDGLGRPGNGAEAATAIGNAMLDNPHDRTEAVRAARVEMRAQKLNRECGATVTGALIKRTPDGKYMMKRIWSGDGEVGVIHPDGHTSDKSPEESEIADLGTTLEDVIATGIYSDARGHVTNSISYDEGELHEDSDDEWIELPPGSVVMITSDGAKFITMEEFAHLVLLRQKSDLVKSLREFERIGKKRCDPVESGKFEDELLSGEWEENGCTFSDGFEKYPPQDNCTIILIRIPYPEGTAVPQQKNGYREMLFKLLGQGWLWGREI